MDSLAQLDIGGAPVTLRRARRDDIADLVTLITDDPVAQRRGDIPDGDIAPYLAAFDLVDASPSDLLVVADCDGAVVGTFQLTFLQGLARRGVTRAQIEAVRVRDDQQGRGLGRAMMRWAIEEAQRRGCGLVQLTSDRSRPDAHRFYEGLGFEASHVGFKLTLA